MPIPGSVLNGPFPFGLPVSDVIYPSKATLRRLDKTYDTTGQVLKTFTDSTVYVDIPCRKSPLIQVRPQNQERDRTGLERFDAQFQINLSIFIDMVPELLAQWQVKVDGRIYQIKSVESDGNVLTTRLMVSDEVPFGG